jgi:RND superfamily putative drug exporter
MKRAPVTVTVARWSAVHPWRAVALWLAFVVAAVVVGGMVGTKEANEEEQASGEYGRAEQIIDRGDFDETAAENVLITARSGTLDPAAAQHAAADVSRRLEALPEVAAVDPPVTAPDGSAVLVRAELSGDPADAADVVAPVLDATAASQAAHPDLRVEQVGDGSIDKALDDALGDDFVRAELTAIPLTLIILVVAFGALIAAAVPVLLALSAVAAAMGLSMLTSHVVPASDVLNSIILLIGLAVGVDYSLFYLRREREERARGRGHVEAVEIAAATSGHAVVVSGVAVVVSMASLYLAGDATFSSIATGAILVVTVAVLGSLTVLPALLAKLGRWVDRPRVPFLWRLTAQRGGAARLWPALLRPVLRRPAITLVVSVAALLALAIPALQMNLTLTTAADLPRSIPVMQTYDRLSASFPSDNGSAHVVAVEAPAGAVAEVDGALAEVARRTADSPLFAHDAKPEMRVSEDGRVTTMSLGLPFDTSDPRAAEGLELLRDELLPAALDGVDGATYAVGGMTSAEVSFTDDMRSALPWVVGFVLLLTFVVLLVTFRSVVIALTAIVLNGLSAAAAFGLLVMTFQGTWAEDLLGFRSNCGIIAWLPLLLFVILFGLSMDYHVFVVSRIREAALRGMPTRDAVAHGITTSAGTVTSAAVIMVAVFSVFATLSMLDMKQMGVGLAAAILIDATIIRAVVLPSAMAVLGRWNWWTPAALRRVLPERGPVAEVLGAAQGEGAPEAGDEAELVGAGAR